MIHDQQIQKIKIAGNKVTKQEVLDAITEEKYVQVGRKITICHLTLADGFEVTGQSAVVDAATFDVKIGNEMAKENAISKAWTHMGSILQDRLITE
jgi:hypothetical protein